jgi:hypothetical protein
VGAQTVARLLKDLTYCLRVNHKRVSRGSGPDRNEQFEYISAQRTRFAQRGLPIVSIDTKKKEMVGNFKNRGTAWQRTPELVNDHDFRSHAEGMATPYGVYDVRANRGAVFVGTSYDTPDFAVDNLVRWWDAEGRDRYPGATELLVLADSGGSNGPRSRVFKYGLQTRLCDAHGIRATLCHYPAGASKWNPIEHRLFSEISKNWAGCPGHPCPRSSRDPAAAQLHDSSEALKMGPNPEVIFARTLSRVGAQICVWSIDGAKTRQYQRH